MADTPAVPVAPPVPEYLKKYMVTADQAGPSDTDAMVATSISIPRVSLKAKKFRYIKDGEEIRAEPETDFVILGVEPGAGKMVKTWYEGAYNPGDTAPPSCASSDGVRPDPWVSNPQNELCAPCKWNAFGSATSRTGKKAKACRDSKRLWLARPDAIDKTVFALNVPVTSLSNLTDLGKRIKESGLPMSAAVVHASMEDDESFPIIKFAIAGWLHEQFGLLAMERNEKKDWEGALKVPNPPVVLEHKPAQGPVAPAVATHDDGSIAGQAVRVEAKPAPDVNDALKTWG